MTGIWLAGGRLDRIESNTVSGHLYGIAVTAGGHASASDRITGNTVSDSVAADVAWDGAGAGVCFSGNRRPDASAVSSEPMHAQTLYPCGPVPAPGIPSPGVLVSILSWGAV